MYTTFDVIDSGIDIELTESQEWSLKDLRQDFPKPRDAYDAPSFFGVIENAAGKSIAGGMARKQALGIDKWHGTADMDMNQWRNVILNLNARSGKGEKFSDLMDECVDEMHKILTQHMQFLECVSGGEMQRDAGGLVELAQDIIEYKFVVETFYGGKVEEIVGDALVENIEGATGWIAHSDEITAEANITNPESAGIDLLLTGIDTTVQVNTGPGGDLQDCDADWVARYIHEEKTAHNWPYVAVEEN